MGVAEVAWSVEAKESVILRWRMSFLDGMQGASRNDEHIRDLCEESH